MALYDYECKCGHIREVWYRIGHAPPVIPCDKCRDKKMDRKLSPSSIMFKGAGFHVNDYGGKK